MRPGDGYTIPQAAALLGCSTDTIRRRVRAGELAAGKDASGRYRVQLDGPAEDGTPDTTAPTQIQGRVKVDGDVSELAALRAHVVLLERERETLTAELATRRQEAEDSARAMGEMRRLVLQAQAMVPRLHDPREYGGAGSEADPRPDGQPRKRRWWQRSREIRASE